MAKSLIAKLISIIGIGGLMLSASSYFSSAQPAMQHNPAEAHIAQPYAPNECDYDFTPSSSRPDVPEGERQHYINCLVVIQNDSILNSSVEEGSLSFIYEADPQSLGYDAVTRIY